MLRRTAVLLAAGLALAGCMGNAPKGAAGAATRLLDAAYRGDRAAFEALLDRDAVREDLRRQVSEMAKGSVLDVDGGASEFALDRMIGPAAIRIVEVPSGRPLAAAPTEAQVAPLLRTVGGGRACLRLATGGGCMLTFGKVDGAWRLVGMKASGMRIELPAKP